MSTKDAYVKEMQIQLEEFSAEIDRLKAKAIIAGAETKKLQEKQLAILEARHEAAEKKLRELKYSSGKAWEDLRMGIVSAWDSVRDALNSATKQFK